MKASQGFNFSTMNLFKKYRWILVLISFSLILRLFIFIQVMNVNPFPDYFEYKQWVYKSYSIGLNNVYKPNPTTHKQEVDQPPGTIIVLRGAFEVFLIVAKTITHFMHLVPGKDLWINDILLVFFFRLPSIIADLILGFLIYIVVKSKSSEKISLLSSAFFLLNPAAIYNSSVWGQTDSINNLLFFICLIFLLKKKAFPSVLFYGLSLFIKASLLPLIPLYLIVGFFGGFFKVKTFLISIFSTFLIILILTLPYFPNQNWFVSFIHEISSGVSQAITVSAFNFWWLIFAPPLRVSPADASDIYFSLTLTSWGYLIFSAFYIPVIFRVFKLLKQKVNKEEMIFFWFAIAAFAAFLFLPKMHERYLYPVLPLLITWVGIKNKYWAITFILSFIHFINLYVVWNPVFIFGFLEKVIRNQSTDWIFSLATFLIFGFLYIKLFPAFSSKS